MADVGLIRSWLYAPGNNARLLEKVFAVGADAVILDLEDAVPVSEKERARLMVSELLRSRGKATGLATFVRVNHPSTGLTREDVAAVVQPGLTGLRLPKVEDPETVRQVERWVVQAEEDAGLSSGSVAFVCNVESALGVWRADQIASSCARVIALGFGAADFVQDVSATVGPQGLETLYARSQLVLASRVARVRPPIDSVYTQLDDADGLEYTTRQGRALGFFGRSAIHPRQVATINAAYTPAEEEITAAREVVDAAAECEASGGGALRLPNGDFVDVAIVRKAETLLRLADSLRTGSTASAD
jgi:citrate lyase subunit beta/citryl-CoA lyase